MWILSKLGHLDVTYVRLKVEVAKGRRCYNGRCYFKWGLSGSSFRLETVTHYFKRHKSL